MKKTDMLLALESGHENLMVLLDDVPEEELTRPGAVGTWSVKDVLSHLLIWEAETIKLLYMARLKHKPQTAHFKTITDDEQNSIWYEQFKDRPYTSVWNDYAAIRDQTIERLAEFTDTDLNNTSLFPWLQGRSLAHLIESFILEHETEHTLAVKTWREKLGI